MFCFRATRVRHIRVALRFRTSSIIDMSAPHLWYPRARQLQRHVICHVGPTNSGKTYTALQELSKASSGMYCGPLRLLAWEISETMRNKSVKCDLVTGQEVDELPDATHLSCTIEMARLHEAFECVVLDECQLIGDANRGWAWTQAFLGIQASTIHLCGNSSFLPLISRLCEITGDRLSVNHYERLSSLHVTEAIGLKDIQKGDCVVAFNRRQLYKLRRQIEKEHNMKCCIIYGSLPPETRREQAKLFNSGTSKYDVLVASDAIGMGLNLSIKRIIFSALEKFDGDVMRPLSITEIKQIAGRAGRYGSAYEVGQVTSMCAQGTAILRENLSQDDPILTKAVLFPTKEQLRLLSIYHDYQLTTKVLLQFWQDIIDESLDQRVQPTTLTVADVHKLTFVLQYFDSLEQYAVHIEQYLKVLYRNNKQHVDLDKPRAQLCKILRLFQSSVQLGTDNLYYIANLEEKSILAEVIDDLPLSFDDKYQFCLAPVDTGNTTILKKFKRMAAQYSRDENVAIPIQFDENCVPMSDVELLELETAHKILDVYLWLGFRYPDNFTEMEHATYLSGVCSDLIEQALVKMSKANPMRKRKEVESQSMKNKKDTSRLIKKNKHKKKWARR